MLPREHWILEWLVRELQILVVGGLLDFGLGLPVVLRLEGAIATDGVPQVLPVASLAASPQVLGALAEAALAFRVSLSNQQSQILLQLNNFDIDLLPFGLGDLALLLPVSAILFLLDDLASQLLNQRAHGAILLAEVPELLGHGLEFLVESVHVRVLINIHGLDLSGEHFTLLLRLRELLPCLLEVLCALI